MERATYEPAHLADRPHAIGHDPSGGPVVDDPACGLVRAAGGAYASARELARFAVAMTEGGRLDPATGAGRGAHDADRRRRRAGLTTGSASSCAGTARASSCRTREGCGAGAPSSPGSPEERFAVAVVLDAPRPTTPSRALDDVYFPSEPEPKEPPIDLGELAGTYRDVNGWLGHLGVEVRAGGLVLVPLGAQRRGADTLWPIPVPIGSGRTSAAARPTSRPASASPYARIRPRSCGEPRAWGRAPG